MRTPFNPLQAAILKALTEALFHGVDMRITSAQVVANLQHQFGMFEGNKPKEIGLSLYLVCFLLGGPFFLLFGPAWGAKRVAKRLARSQNNLMQDLARIRGVIYAGYYGHWVGAVEEDNDDNPVLNAIGFELPHQRIRGTGEVPIRLFPGRDLAHDDVLAPNEAPDTVGVIVIGSGAGGAVAAANLAQHHDVLVIEAGAHYPSAAITHEERRMTARLFVDGGLQTSRDHDIVIFQGHCVGGSTVINNGIALRVKQAGMTHPQANDVFANWAALGAPVDAERFNAAYHAVEKRLGVEPIDQKSGRNNGTHLLNGWAAHAAASSDPMDAASPALWFSKNYGPRELNADCAYCGYCNTGCPYGRKQGMAQSFLIDARSSGAKILMQTKVEKIIWAESDLDGRRVATGVEVLQPDGSRRTIRATKGVVVAAGTMASSRILDKSGIEGTGEGISLNIACPVVALMPGTMRAWDEDQMATYVDRGDFLLESHFQPPMSMSTLMPGWFGDHAGRMLNYSRLASAGILFPADRQGRLIGGKLHFKLRDDVELPLLRRALATLTRVHFAAGAEEVYPALTRGPILRKGDDIDLFYEQGIREADDVTLSSSHPQGGNGRNADPEKGVVDLDCRVHGTANVLVTDASTFTSCIRVNAQLTTMAMSHYATAGNPFV
ncbi:GMC family oxidoreductase N-terminal domain-containing protein [Sphingomonas alpina]|uniref:GMC family oxidoreductase N-terminal domain-containing protein n=1 Tax=Sphingomonas alpina TaxID=653931 RepID=A0A7H0LJX9_9SPHN|nr:GMC family oxidoreductase N-terminal domain-containing protein [Sphingomonas alpina]QNQ09982.1 GMC family oxidoreductase N-terminal domain-containing protein [Sphingomonas alpina]